MRHVEEGGPPGRRIHGTMWEAVRSEKRTSGEGSGMSNEGRNAGSRARAGVQPGRARFPVKRRRRGRRGAMSSTVSHGQSPGWKWPGPKPPALSPGPSPLARRAPHYSFLVPDPSPQFKPRKAWSDPSPLPQVSDTFCPAGSRRTPCPRTGLDGGSTLIRRGPCVSPSMKSSHAAAPSWRRSWHRGSRRRPAHRDRSAAQCIVCHSQIPLQFRPFRRRSP